ncbi:AAA family ATPase [Kitasatospora sp. NPDC001603]|uniref:helix-turn-helix transcriptional regulator n=1 Tax=Kitasatospora sp. NPDC001603 TaxID=3154388 RepID=UPI00331D0049
MQDSATWFTGLQETYGAVLPVAPDDLRGIRRVVLFGPPGIGKTTAAGALARRLGRPVLRLAPGPQDTGIPYTGLLELALALRPLPSAGELATALDETGTGPSSPDGSALALRLRRLTATVLREAPPVTLVVDNTQWLDEASTAVLGWALRQAPELPVIATERTWRPEAGGHWSGEDAYPVRVPALSTHQIASLLSHHRPDPSAVARLHIRSGGNPALALALAEACDRSAQDDPLLPPAARRLLGEWLATVSDDVCELLTLAALDDRPDRELLARLAGPAADNLLAQAETAALIDPGDRDGRVRFTASAIGTELTTRLTDAARRLLHARLAQASYDPARRARHTTLAADTADPRTARHTARDAARAAGHARLRGEHPLAAELSLLAAQRTPHDEIGLLTERALTAVRDAAHCGDLPRARTATRLILEYDTSPAQRVGALLTLLDASGQRLHSADELFAAAIHETAGRPGLTAQVLLRQAIWANVNEGDPRRASALAERSASLARTADDTTTAALALTMQARIQRILGHPQAETTLKRALSLPRTAPVTVNTTPEHLAARHALFDDRPEQARTTLLPLLVQAQRTGDTEATVDLLRSLAEAELRTGRCAQALDYAHRAQALTDRTALSPAPACYTSALVEGTTRDTGAALAHARRGIDASRHEDNMVFLSRNLYALGHLLLATDRPKEALEPLEEVRALEERQQVRDPSVLRWHPDLAEALLAVGRPAEAEALLTDTHRTATDLGRTSVLPALERARALLDAARGDYDTAARRLTGAADRLRDLPLERGRTLLALSHTERRARRRASARTAAQKAADLFAAHGAHPWTDAATHALHRLKPSSADAGARPRLTGAEERCARLAAAGASNRDIAATLTVSVKTVEATLTRVYRKLDLRSRVQLAHAITPAPE